MILMKMCTYAMHSRCVRGLVEEGKDALLRFSANPTTTDTCYHEL